MLLVQRPVPAATAQGRPALRRARPLVRPVAERFLAHRAPPWGCHETRLPHVQVLLARADQVIETGRPCGAGGV